MKHILKNFGTKLILTVAFIAGLSIYTKAEDIRMVIKEERANCTGVGPQTCYLVKYSNSKDWEFFYGGIVGFNYKPGYRYTLLVSRTKRANVPADASMYIYRVKRVIKTQRISQGIEGSQHTGAIDFVYNHKWKLIQMDGITQDESPAYLIFHREDQRFNGSGGCNNIFGGYEFSKGAITFQQIGSTMMACSEEAMKAENTFVNLLNDKTFRYDIADQTLNFYLGNKLVLMFGMTDLEIQ
ncbi:META domain-containing protein [Pedobacter sp. PAMC26386]|nr:META domain-containing protein [Pedobacter sp. PAMC26386]